MSEQLKYFSICCELELFMRNEILKYERIRNIRIERNLTQQQIAEFLNVKQNTYSQYEIGALNYPLDIIIKLAIFLTQA